MYVFARAEHYYNIQTLIVATPIWSLEQKTTCGIPQMACTLLFQEFYHPDSVLAQAHSRAKTVATVMVPQLGS